MKRALSSIFSLSTILLAACAMKVIHVDPKTRSAETANTFTMTMEWLKVKRTHFDTSINLTNETDGPLTILKADIICQSGDQTGTLSLVEDYGYGTTVISFRGHESKNFIFRCWFASKAVPPYRFGVSKVSSGSAVVANNLTIEQLDN